MYQYTISLSMIQEVCIIKLATFGISLWPSECKSFGLQFALTSPQLRHPVILRFYLSYVMKQNSGLISYLGNT